MVSFQQLIDEEYQIKVDLIPIKQVTLYERKLLPEYINAEGNNITDSYIQWAEPFILWMWLLRIIFAYIMERNE